MLLEVPIYTQLQVLYQFFFVGKKQVMFLGYKKGEITNSHPKR